MSLRDFGLLSILKSHTVRPMVLMLDGTSENGAHTRSIRYFDLLKASGYIDRVVKSDFFGKLLSYFIRAKNVLS